MAIISLVSLAPTPQSPTPTAAANRRQQEQGPVSSLRTLTVTRDGTTETSVFTLGSSEATTKPYSPNPAPGISQETLGGIIGGVVSAIVLVLLLLVCCGRVHIPTKSVSSGSSRSRSTTTSRGRHHHHHHGGHGHGSGSGGSSGESVSSASSEMTGNYDDGGLPPMHGAPPGGGMPPPPGGMPPPPGGMAGPPPGMPMFMGGAGPPPAMRRGAGPPPP